MLEGNDFPDGSKNSLGYLPPPMGGGNNRSTNGPGTHLSGVCPPRPGEPEMLCLLPWLISRGALGGPPRATADDLPWGLVLPAAGPSWAGIPQALQRAQGELASAKPLPKAEGLEESSAAGVSFFWSEGCSSLGGAAGPGQEFSWCLKDMFCSGWSVPCPSPGWQL